MAAHGFKRVLFGLQPGSPGRAMRFAAELAGLLDLELLGLFVEDTNLRDLASIPFAREFRPLGGGWHAIDLDRMSYDLELAARRTERMFAAAAKRLAATYQFEVIRGPIAEAITSVSRTGDIVMIVEPLSPAERATQQFSWLIEAAFRSTAAVMLVPVRIARRSGPIVAVAVARDDPSIQVAASIARAAKEELIIVTAYDGGADDSAIRKLAAYPGLTIKHVAKTKFPPSGPAALPNELYCLQERLLVMTHGVFAAEVASMMASTRGVPVLVLEPSPETTDPHGFTRSQTRH